MAKINAPVSKGVPIMTINPLAPVLGPLQRILGKVLVHVRTVHRVLAWEDRFVTTIVVRLTQSKPINFASTFVRLNRDVALSPCVCAGAQYCQLVLLTLVLLIIPWAFLLHWGARLVGFLLFGPHMHLVGRLLARNAAKAAEIESRYQKGDSKVRKEMIAEVSHSSSRRLELASGLWLTLLCTTSPSAISLAHEPCP